MGERLCKSLHVSIPSVDLSVVSLLPATDHPTIVTQKMEQTQAPNGCVAANGSLAKSFQQERLLKKLAQTKSTDSPCSCLNRSKSRQQ